MASVYRPKYSKIDPQTGRRTVKRSRVYIAEFKGADGLRKRVTTEFRDKKAASEWANDQEKKARLIRKGLAQSYEESAATPVKKHVEAYRDHLFAKGRTKQHAELTTSRVLSVLNACGFLFLRDLDADRALAHLADRRKTVVTRESDGTIKTVEKDEPISVASRNGYVRALKMFGTWLSTKAKRWPENPFRSLSTANEETDRKHSRRALSPGEFSRLIESARSGPTLRGLSGPDRALLYEVAASTGLRARALACLTPGHFDLEAETPRITATADVMKSGNAETKPLPEPLRQPLKVLIGLRPANEPVWRGTGTWVKAAAGMVRSDLKRAGLSYRDDSGRVFDFHSLRGQCGSDHARAGTPLVVTQKLLGHSDPRLTARYYTHLRVEDLAGAVEHVAVHRVTEAEAEAKKAEAKEKAAKATGTDGEARLGVNLGGAHANQHPQAPSSARSEGTENEKAERPENTGKQGENVEGNGVARGETRTPTRLPSTDFESVASTSQGVADSEVAGIDHAGLGACLGEESEKALLDSLAADPELTRILTTWPALPDHVRQTILTLIEAAGA